MDQTRVHPADDVAPVRTARREPELRSALGFSLPDRRLRFTLRDILAGFWGLSCIFAGMKIGTATTFAVGIPLGILGLRWFSGRTSVLNYLKPRMLVLLCGLLLTGLLVLMANPVDLNSGLALCGGIAWSQVWQVSSFKTMAALIVLPLWMALGYCGERIQDVRGGRLGVEVAGCRFVTHSERTPLLESYLGPLEARWAYCGGDRINGCSLTRYEKLPEILAMLPNDDARRKVLHCLTDPENRMRVHQGMLLFALQKIGYPPGHDAQSWWNKHGHLFRQEHNATTAAVIVWGWRERVEAAAPWIHSHSYPWDNLDAASRLDLGQIDWDVAQALYKINRTVWSSPHQAEDFPELGVHSIDWWPAPKN